MSPQQILFSVVGLIKVGKETENGRAKKIITGRIQDDAAVRAGYAGGIGSENMIFNTVLPMEPSWELSDIRDLSHGMMTLI